MDLEILFSTAFKKRRKELGISRMELKRMTGISYSYLWMIENGRITTTNMLNKICDALGLVVEIKCEEEM